LPFHVPADLAGFFDEIDRKFRLLLHEGVITGIDQGRLNMWLANFRTPEDKYLAAHILSGLTYRSDAMIRSSFRHLVHSELPATLRTTANLTFPDIETFEKQIQVGDGSTPFRFVAVDGQFEGTPGKSGAVVIRQFRRHLAVSKALTCRPEDLGQLPASVRALLFVDDMLGTGKQFIKFARFYKLQDHANNRALIYCPLVAFDKGITKIRDELPWLHVQPVETLGASHQFFRPYKDDLQRWDADRVNLLEDVRMHVDDICNRAGLPARTQHSLDLVVAFEHAVPNNSLPMLSIQTSTWVPLFER